jgi:hypothetical protein
VAGAATVGASFPTTTDAKPVTPPLLAESVATPVSPPAEYSPFPSIVPTPAPLPQVITGCTASAAPNWSYPTAPSASVWFTASEKLPGDTTIELNVAATVSDTVLVVDSVPSLTVTANEYTPACVKFTAVVFAAFVPFTVNVGLPGPDKSDHVYVSPLSPASSDPSTLKLALTPVTVDGPLAGAAIVGAPFTTVTPADPLTPPALAVTVAPPAVVPAVNSPVPFTPPTPVRVHVNVGCVVSASPNWSLATALNWLVPFKFTVGDEGVTAIDVAFCTTVSVTALLVVSDPSLIVTKKLYTPAFENVTVVDFDPFVPFAENCTAPGPDVTDQLYVRPLSPPSSVAAAFSIAVVPVTLGVFVFAGVSTSGAPLLTVTVADPVSDPYVARTVAVPDCPGAWYTPAADTVPTLPASSDQATAPLNACPNWSVRNAENGDVAFGRTVPFAPCVTPGATTRCDAIESTCTFTCASVDCSPSDTCTWNV